MLTLPAKRMRVILKFWDWRQSGNKDALVVKATLHLRLVLLADKSLFDSLSANEETSRYESWIRMRLSKDEAYPVSVDKVPSEKDLLSMISVT